LPAIRQQSIPPTESKTMTEKVNDHGSTPSDLKSPVYRHPSLMIQSPSNAGGKVPTQQYTTQVLVRKTK
jgi:hypothetical protein